ncbi:cyanophycin synthetase [Duganella sp. Leaf126]|uniref:cyanophycin synthetase n=1 Tax=Duganella sp. Leaf126 TaxID=1736266 RepID=UPI0006FC95CD|nr:cyanophycin synthetase [Duganella sp. Leaf126]KQQ36242.1 cyanophycin synthetase [Duganella sp. Leaf126]
MNLIEQRVLRGPNLYSSAPCLLTVIDLAELQGVSTSALPHFNDALLALMPSLAQHYSPPGKPGGFVQRLQQGTYMARVVEHVALELQTLAGAPVGFGRSTPIEGQPGRYRVICGYQFEQVAQEAFALAMALVSHVALTPEQPFAFDDPLDDLREHAERRAIGTSTGAVIDAATRRGIPSLRLTEEANLFQLGWGARQKRLQATVTGNTSLVAANIASDKQLTKTLLAGAGVPVPRGRLVTDVEQALRAARRIGVPVTIKPLDANQGKGVTTVCITPEQIETAFEHARGYSRRVIVEQYLEGHDYRVLVTGNQVAAASRRRPPEVTGDGVRTIAELVAHENLDPARGDGHTNILTKMRLDQIAEDLVRKQGYSFDSVPPAGVVVALRGNANLSTGGTAEDATDLLHPLTRDICIRAARTIGLDVAGIDIICRDIGVPLDEQDGGIIEVNAAPGIRMHQYPSSGQPRDAGDAIVEAMFGKDNGRIPVIAVTGTNGKTTTALLLGHAGRVAKLGTGVTTTEGVFINGTRIDQGDCSGYWSARKVLTSTEVDFAVLETARGGILKRGLAFDRCDVGVVLNVSADHLGMDGVETLADLAEVKAVVARTASRAVVLNAEDPYCVRMASQVEDGVEVLYFSLDPEHPVLLAHLEHGGRAAWLQDGVMTVSDGAYRHAVIDAAAVPMSVQGHAMFNVANALAATAALMASGFQLAQITTALASFVSDSHNNPLRSNIYSLGQATVVVDYAHNPAAYRALGKMARSLVGATTSGKVIGVVTAPGDRRDADLRDVGRSCAIDFNELIVYQSNPRGRADGATGALIVEGIRQQLRRDGTAVQIDDVHRALAVAIAKSQPGDVLVFSSPSTPHMLVEALRPLYPEQAAIIAADLQPMHSECQDA